MIDTENAESVVSGLIDTENTESVVSGLIDTENTESVISRNNRYWEYRESIVSELIQT